MKTLQYLKSMRMALISITTTLCVSLPASAEVTFEEQYKVSDLGLYFNGTQTKGTSPNQSNPDVMDYAFGPRISAHGDAIKVYEEFIFTTWYKGGKYSRNLMLSRYNTITGVLKTIQFPHKHTGYRGDTFIGESHNTAAIGISPKDGKMHILYDMHSYNNVQFPNDYFRYSYSIEDAATVADADFKLNLFVADGTNDYGHNNLNGVNDASQFSDLTYPTFFLNEDNDLLFYMRTGGNNNGGYLFTKYNASTSKWNDMTQFNYVNAKTKSNAVDYNWGLYGEMKYVNGKLRTAFQKRSANNDDKYQYQNGIYYAYSNDQSGKTQWKNHKGEGFNVPFANPEPLKIYEPGNLVDATGKDEVHIVGGFDFTVTDQGDVHIVSMVKDKTINKTVKLHSYKPSGANDFTHTTDFNGGSSLYTSGEFVYIIGLKNGRPFIQRAQGGTNNFTTVYEDQDGQSFAHGVVNIHEGKVYYFLQAEKFETYTQNGQEKRRLSTKMPLYVQVIDLDIEDDGNSQPVPPDFTPPEGYTLASNAAETVEITGTMNVAFGSNGEFNYQYNQTQNIECTREVFGDPVPGVAKKCYTQEVIVDEYCSSADTRWSVAQEKFAQKCADFAFERCETTTTNSQDWIVCSSKRPALDHIVIVDDSQAVRIEAEDYARAVDISPGNKGEVYRPGDVDIEATTDIGGGHQVGWINQADTLSYDLLVSKAGVYELEVRVANNNADAKLSAMIDEQNVLENQTLVNTGSDTAFETARFEIGELAEGAQVLTLQFSEDMKFNWFKLNFVSDIPGEGEVEPEPLPEYEYGRFSVDQSSFQVDEFTSTLQIEILRVDGSDQVVELEYKLSDDTAVAGQDYQLQTGVLNFADGQTSALITIEIIDDFEYELQEQFNVEFIRQSQEVTGELLSDLTVVIIDNDPSEQIGDFGFEFETISVNEQDSQILLNVVRENGSDGEVIIDVALEHLSTNSEDFTLNASNLVFADNEQTKQIQLAINNDVEFENDETFKLVLSSLNSDVLFNNKQIIVTIISDDQLNESVAFDSNELEVDEGETLEVQVNRQMAVLTEKTYALIRNENSTLTADDFTIANMQVEFATDENAVTFNVVVHNDEKIESQETLILDLLDTEQNEVLSSIAIKVNDKTQPVLSESGIVEISGTSFSVNENDGEIEIQLLRHSGMQGSAIVDVILTSQQAIEGEDYVWMNQSVTFVEDQTMQSIRIDILDDQIFESDEVLNLSIVLSAQNTSNAVVGANNQARITIVDNDADQQATLVKFETQALQITENESKIVTVTRQGDLTDSVIVNLEVMSDLVQGVDFEISVSQIEFTALQSQIEFEVSALTGSAKEQNDSEITLILSAIDDSQVGGNLVIDIVPQVVQNPDLPGAPDSSNDNNDQTDQTDDKEKSSGSFGLLWLSLFGFVLFNRRLFLKIR